MEAYELDLEDNRLKAASDIVKKVNSVLNTVKMNQAQIFASQLIRQTRYLCGLCGQLS